MKILIAIAFLLFANTSFAESKTYILQGKASYYADKFQDRLTANGEKFDQAALTAAHKKLPFGTKVKVTNTETGKSVVVRINDRGPFVEEPLIESN